MLSNALQTRGVAWPIQALLAALLIGGLGPVVLEMEGTLPLSLQSMLVCWIPLMLGWKAGLTALLLYLGAGILGLPVFAGYASGMAVIAGPTGGYLLGFPIVAALLGWVADNFVDRPIRTQFLAVAAGMVFGHVLILAFGIPWQARFDPDLNVRVLVERLLRPIALKSAIGLLLSVLLMRSVQGRA